MSSILRSGRLAVLSLCAVLAACSATDLSTAPEGQAAKGGGSGGGGTPAPAFFQGTWTQAPPSVQFLIDGSRVETTVFLDLTQKGTTISGTARKSINAYYADGTVLIGYDPGSHGKVTGTVIANGLSLAVKSLGETKVNFGLVLSLSADSTVLTNTLGNATLYPAFYR